MSKPNLKNLRKIIPFKWRVQSKFDWQGSPWVRLIAYVDARDVAEHLDDILGPQNWRDEFYEVAGVTFCRIGIRHSETVNGKDREEWIYKSDAGTESNVEAKKGAASDAFKRAAVKWGVNRAAYRAALVMLPAVDKGKGNKPLWLPADESGRVLKGKALYDVCNAKAKITEMDDYEPDYGSEEVEEVEVEEVKPQPANGLGSHTNEFDKIQAGPNGSESGQNSLFSEPEPSSSHF